VAKLIYLTIQSLDGYIEDEAGEFGWGEPDDEVHAFINDVARSVGTFLYGRRLYETMLVWETLPLDDAPAYIRDFADIWRAADKIVYSRNLDHVPTANTRIEREFDPGAVRALKTAATDDLAIGGAELAAEGFKTGLVDELRLVVPPVVVGGGKPSLPGGVHLELELLDERRFGSGFVYLRYALRGGDRSS
jgi:dihydrofolate reductase